MDTEWTTEDIRLGFAQSRMRMPFFNGGAEQIQQACLEFNDWFREVQAEAWEWGQIHSGTAAPNPYRKATHG